MCGINGLFYFDPSRPAEQAVVEAMRRVANHRGPDDSGTLFDGPVGLGFNRLSIIDVSGGHQPMSNEDGTVWIIFNGEIYNFQSLREELIAAGHRFVTKSDTETIVHAYEQYGEACLDRLQGMFAFAIWDARNQTLFAARDRLGIKPLYYYQDRDVFAFASEMKQLFELPGIPREIDRGALSQFLLRRYVAAPHTIARGINKLPPAHWVKVNHRGVQVQRYWDLPTSGPRTISDADAFAEFDVLMKDTVRHHLISEVPLGAFLSGGLDSSAMVAFMSELGVDRIRTFSIGYDSPESELPYARIVADHFKTEHHEMVLQPAQFQGMLPRIVWMMDEPVADEAALPLFFVAQLARRHVTVALSGEGSDEVFSGYPIYRMQMALERASRLPLARAAGAVLEGVAPSPRIRKYARQLGRPLEQRYAGVGSSFDRGLFNRLMTPSGNAGTVDFSADLAEVYAQARNQPLLNRMSAVDLKTWLPGNLLVKADRMSMGNSLELRVPFLDHKVVEFGYQLPPSLKIRGNNGKWILKKYMEPRLPASIIYRPKKGFAVPTSSWFSRDISTSIRESLLAAGGAADEFFSRSVIEEVLSAPASRDQSGQIYSLLVIDQWYRQFIRRSA